LKTFPNPVEEGFGVMVEVPASSNYAKITYLIGVTRNMAKGGC